MPETSTGTILRTTREIVRHFGLHTDEQFATNDGRLDLSAAVFRAVTGKTPNAFLTDEKYSLVLIEANPAVMAAIRIISLTLPTEACVTEIAPGYEVPDYVEHVSNWAATAPVFGDRPPTVEEILDVLARAADNADYLAASATRDAA